MIALWRIGVATALGSLVGSQGYSLWQLRNVSDTWKWAALGAAVGALIGCIALLDRFAKPS